MAEDAQLDESAGADPPAELLRVAGEVVPDWLRRIGTQAARRTGNDTHALADDLETMADDLAAELLGLLDELLSIDVDDQPVNPLSLFRAAVVGPTDVLRRHGVPAPGARDAFASAAFPDDPYGIGPATWADIDERMQGPGLAWGAWKAMTVLQRRRNEGLR